MVWFDCLFNNAVPVVGCSFCILLKASMVTQYVHSHACCSMKVYVDNHQHTLYKSVRFKIHNSVIDR